MRTLLQSIASTRTSLVPTSVDRKGTNDWTAELVKSTARTFASTKRWLQIFAPAVLLILPKHCIVTAVCPIVYSEGTVQRKEIVSVEMTAS